jgi:mycothiol synthase
MRSPEGEARNEPDGKALSRLTWVSTVSGMREPGEPIDDSTSRVAVRPILARDDLGPVLRVFELMDLAEVGEVVTGEADVRVLIAGQDMGAWAAIVAGEVTAFGSLGRRSGTEELRAQFASVPGADQACAVMLDQLGAEAVAAGSREVGLWQITDGLAGPSLSMRGWRPVRTYARMVLELGRRPQLPRRSGVTVRIASEEAGLRLVHELTEEALAGHWDHRPRGFEEFCRAQADAEGHDPELWYLAFVDGDPAGALIARVRTGRGLIGWLGTRPEFRRRGVASALLSAAFDELQTRGVSRVEVDVDTANATNASRVYERAGMRVQFQSTHWRLTLRP